MAESFTTTGNDNLDADIDARADDVPADEWTGFHRIEKGLFEDKSLTGLATYGDGLVANVQQAADARPTGLTYQPAELANGAVELLDEVVQDQDHRRGGAVLAHRHARLRRPTSRAPSRRSPNLQPGLAKIDPALATTVATGFTALDTLLDKYRSTDRRIGLRPLQHADRRRQDRSSAQALQAVSRAAVDRWPARSSD